MRVNTASHFEPEKVRFPVLGSVKMDGWRAYNSSRVLFTRSNKPVPNAFTQLRLNAQAFHGLDGELCAGNPWDANLMQQSQSAFSAEHGEPEFTWQVFDIFNLDLPYEARYALLKGALTGTLDIGRKDFADFAWNSGIRLVDQKILLNMQELEAFEEESLIKGYEGIMLRDPQGKYKQGKSTVREGGLLKVKRYTDSEMVANGMEEQQYNGNEAFTDELGRTKRSSAQAGKVGKDTLGVLVGTDVVTGQTVRLGTGFTDEQRLWIWRNWNKVSGTLSTYKHFAHGVKDGIRHGVWKSFRSRLDMD